MNKNVKVGLSFIGGAIFVAGMELGMIINEKLNQKYTEPTIKRYRELSENFKDLLCKEYEKNEVLKKEVLKMKREEANRK